MRNQGESARGRRLRRDCTELEKRKPALRLIVLQHDVYHHGVIEDVMLPHGFMELSAVKYGDFARL